MVVFTIGAHVLDTILIKSTSIVIDVMFSLTTWSAKSLVKSVWKTTPTEHELLCTEIKHLQDNINLLDSLLDKTIHDDDDYVLI